VARLRDFLPFRAFW